MKTEAKSEPLWGKFSVSFFSHSACACSSAPHSLHATAFIHHCEEHSNHNSASFCYERYKYGVLDYFKDDNQLGAHDHPRAPDFRGTRDYPGTHDHRRAYHHNPRVSSCRPMHLLCDLPDLLPWQPYHQNGQRGKVRDTLQNPRIRVLYFPCFIITLLFFLSEADFWSWGDSLVVHDSKSEKLASKYFFWKSRNNYQDP